MGSELKDFAHLATLDVDALLRLSHNLKFDGPSTARAQYRYDDYVNDEDVDRYALKARSGFVGKQFHLSSLFRLSPEEDTMIDHTLDRVLIPKVFGKLGLIDFQRPTPGTNEPTEGEYDTINEMILNGVEQVKTLEFYFESTSWPVLNDPRTVDWKRLDLEGKKKNQQMRFNMKV